MIYLACPHCGSTCITRTTNTFRDFKCLNCHAALEIWQLLWCTTDAIKTSFPQAQNSEVKCQTS